MQTARKPKRDDLSRNGTASGDPACNGRGWPASRRSSSSVPTRRTAGRHKDICPAGSQASSAEYPIHMTREEGSRYRGRLPDFPEAGVKGNSCDELTTAATEQVKARDDHCARLIPSSAADMSALPSSSVDDGGGVGSSSASIWTSWRRVRCRSRCACPSAFCRQSTRWLNRSTQPATRWWRLVRRKSVYLSYTSCVANVSWRDCRTRHGGFVRSGCAAARQWPGNAGRISMLRRGK
ncbi:hypothetical protein DM82_3817 [Burkholderia oklahomensis]|uniref:Uncharacterized protein n=1 Tax=Burkholderia oklahomensis TaxID=342113 RepID=A0AAI8BDM3_9BURK|nr:hypothetical protein DM82_3817 [Burkholderia oklahomensis]